MGPSQRNPRSGPYRFLIVVHRYVEQWIPSYTGSVTGSRRHRQIQSFVYNALRFGSRIALTPDCPAGAPPRDLCRFLPQHLSRHTRGLRRRLLRL